MWAALFVTALAALVPASRAQTDSPKPGVKHNAITEQMQQDPFTLAFYTEMSFYTPADKTGTVILHTIPNAETHEAFHKLTDGRPTALEACVTLGNSNDILLPWTEIQYPAILPVRLTFPLDRFPPQEEPYVLRLNVVSKDGMPVSTKPALLRVLSDEEGKNLARQNRLEEAVYKWAQGYTSVNHTDEEQSEDSPSTQNVPSAHEDLQGVRRPLPEHPGANGFLPDGWWQRVLPAHINQTNWDHVQKTWRTGNVTNWMEDIKVAGYNVIHPANGSGHASIPFDATLRWEISKAADGHDLSILYDVDFKSPGHSFKEYYEDSYPGASDSQTTSSDVVASQPATSSVDPFQSITSTVDAPVQSTTSTVDPLQPVTSIAPRAEDSASSIEPIPSTEFERVMSVWPEMNRAERRAWTKAFMKVHRCDLDLTQDSLDDLFADVRAADEGRIVSLVELWQIEAGHPTAVLEKADDDDSASDVDVEEFFYRTAQVWPWMDKKAKKLWFLHFIQGFARELVPSPNFWSFVGGSQGNGTYVTVRDPVTKKQMPKQQKDLIACHAADTLTKVLNEYLSPETIHTQPDSVKQKIALQGTQSLLHVLDTHMHMAPRKEHLHDQDPTSDSDDDVHPTPRSMVPCTCSEADKKDIVRRFRRRLAEAFNGKVHAPAGKRGVTAMGDEASPLMEMDSLHRDMLEDFERNTSKGVANWFSAIASDGNDNIHRRSEDSWDRERQVFPGQWTVVDGADGASGSWEREPRLRTRSLRDVMRGVDRCVRDPECVVEDEDFVEAGRMKGKKSVYG